MSQLLYIVLGLVYFAALSLLFRRIHKKNEIALSWHWMIAAFAAKVMAGMLYGYLYAHVFAVSDSWFYFRESLEEYQKLIKHPASFFLTGLNVENAGDMFSTADNNFWSNVGENLLIKLLAIFNLLSRGNYYVNVVLFNALPFFGLYLIFLISAHFYKRNLTLLYGLIFFLPSCLFWNSGIDKDGLIVFFTGWLIHSVHYLFSGNSHRKHIVFCVVSFIAVLLLRPVNAVLLIPALSIWWLSAKFPAKAFYVALGAAVFFVVLFFMSGMLSPALDFPLKLAEKQHQFLTLEANTVLPLTPLEPNFFSYVKVFPQAVNHIFLRPYISELKSAFHLMTFLENMLMLVVMVLAIIKARSEVAACFKTPYFLFLLVLSFSGFILIGYTTPFPGTIVRYKALYAVLFLIPFVHLLAGSFRLINNKK